MKKMAAAWTIVAAAALACVAGETRTGEPRIAIKEASFRYWSPEMHQLHVRLLVQARPIGGEERIIPKSVRVDDQPVRESYWYFDGENFAYGSFSAASRRRIEVFVPLPWRANRRYQVTLSYEYGGVEEQATATLAAPATGGTWERATGPNRSFLVREQAALARVFEPVEFDLTVPAIDFPQPERLVRATVMSEPGVFRELPCQVYSVEHHSQSGGGVTISDVVRFRATIPISFEPNQERLVILWSCTEPPRDVPVAVRLQGSAIGGTVENRFYRIALQEQGGQLESWFDKRFNLKFEYFEGRSNPPGPHPIQITPDVFRHGAPWSHASDWKEPAKREIAGPVFVETIRGGPMAGAPEILARVTYRFYGERPEVRISSVMRVIRDTTVMAFRNGGMIFDHRLFTHAAWPRQDGTVNVVPISECRGNDNGAPPPGRFPWDTPWVAFYNADTRIGIALITTRLAFFHDGAYHPNHSGGLYYVSLYHDRFLYTVRAMNMNYSSHIRTYPSLLRAGTTLYEEMAMMPFQSEAGSKNPFESVEALRAQILRPLVLVP